MRAEHRPLLAAAVVALGACSPAAPRALVVPLPEAASKIVASRPADGGPLIAGAERADAPLVVGIAALPAEVIVLGYSDGLEDLGLAPGPIAAEADCARSCRLLAPLYALHAQFDREDQAPSWTPLEPLPPALADLLLPDRGERCGPQCISHSRIEIPLMPGDRVRFMVPDGPEGALIGLGSGSLLRVGLAGKIEERCAASDLPFSAGARTPGDDRLWVATSRGDLGMLRLSAQTPGRPCSLENVTPSAAGEQITRIAIGAGASPELLTAGAVSSTIGTIIYAIAGRFDGRRYTQQIRLELVAEDLDRGQLDWGGVVWLPDGRGLAAAGSAQLAWFEASGPRIEAVVLNGNQPKIQSLALATDGQPLLGTDPFGPVARRENAWAPLLEFPGARNVGLLFVEPDRVYFTASGGLLGQWVRGAGSCPLEQTGFGRAPRYGLELSGGRILIGDPINPQDQVDNFMLFFVPTPDHCGSLGGS